MASAHSYKITLSNNKTKREALDYLLMADESFLLPDLVGRKIIMEKLGLDKQYLRTFDLIKITGHTNKEIEIEAFNKEDVTLIEIKSTQKMLKNNPYGFFFGATANEFELAQKLGHAYRFCFVCLHPQAKSHVLLDLDEVNGMINNKRIQYQISFKSK